MSKPTASGLTLTLPYFRIIYSNSNLSQENKSTNMIPAKPKRKKRLEVQVHTTNKNESKDLEHRTYSAQFNGNRRKHKHRNSEINESQPKEQEDENAYAASLEVIETDVHKIKKRTLIESHERIYAEYKLLVQKLNETQDYFNKKNIKLKEKLDRTQKVNEDVIIENNAVKTQYENLLLTLEDFKVKLENGKHSNLKLDEAFKKSQRDNHELRETNKRLIEDTNMLKNVVYRLNVQMERYQGKKDKTISLTSNQLSESIANLESNTKEAFNPLLESHMEHPHIPISWGSVNSHTLGPLLDAYQETISEKEEIIENYEKEMSNFANKVKEIINENEILHKKLTNDDECSIKLKEELERVGLELKNIKGQNDLLIKKCALKQDKLDEVLRCYEIRVEQGKRDYNVAVEQYHKSKIEVSSLKERIKSLTELQDDFKNERKKYIPVDVHSASVSECKQLYEELKQQYEIEKNKLKDIQATLQKQVLELTGATNNLKSEKEDLNRKLESYEKQIKKSESKSSDLKHVLHETQLSRTACKKQLNKAMEFAKELVSEQETLLKVLQQRQQENKAVKEIGSDIANRMDTLKSKLKCVQRNAWQELSTVEQRIKDQDSVIGTMKREHDEEVERLKRIIQRKEENNLLLKNSNASIPMPHYLLLKDRNMN